MVGPEEEDKAGEIKYIYKHKHKHKYIYVL